MKLTKQERHNLAMLQRFRLFEWYVQLRSLQHGQCFGQEAFEQVKPSRQVREATMRAGRRTVLAILSQDSYMRVLKTVESKKRQDAAAFLARLPFFEHLPMRQARSLVKSSAEVDCRKNQSVI